MIKKPIIDEPSQEGDAPVSQLAKVSPRSDVSPKPDETTNAFVAAQTAPSQTANNAQHHPKKHKRTLGLRLFDGGAYAIVINTSVMAVSIITTYLTQHGSPNNFFRQRGDQIRRLLTNRGMGEDTAKMTNAVFWSFVDGTVLSPLTKILEDNRIKIAHWIDQKTGHEPADQSVYKEEPKQSWLSVIGGRLSVLSLVLPTAFLFEKFPAGTKTLDKLDEHGNKKVVPKNLNRVLFTEKGEDLAKEIVKRPRLLKYFGKMNEPQIAGLMGISLFELVYTSICTFGGYFISRNFANKIEHRKEVKEAKPHSAATITDAPVVSTVADEPNAQPSAQISGAQHVDRLANNFALGQAPA